MRVRACQRQQGVALVMVLLMFAILSMMAADIIRQLSVSVRLEQALLDKTQARLYAIAGEQQAQLVLTKHWQDEQKSHERVDNLQQSWAQPQVYPLEKGKVAIRIEDAQGRFDLNRLANAVQAHSAKGVLMMRAWLQAASVSIEKITAINQWIARYPVRINHGPSSQSGRPTPNDHKAKKTQQGMHIFTDVSQLRTIAGLSETDYQKLHALSVVLTGTLPINVNTASLAVLQTLGTRGLSAARAKQLIIARSQHGFIDVNAFLAQPALAGQDVNAKAISVDSQYFIVTTTGQYDGMQALLTSLLYRDKHGVIRVIWRRYGTLW